MDLAKDVARLGRIPLVVVLEFMALMAATGASEKKPVIISVPPVCIDVDRFYGPCPPSKYGGNDCKVHVKVKPNPDCNQYNTQQAIHVPIE